MRIILFIGCILGTIGMILLGQFVGSFLISIPHEILENINPKIINDAWITAEKYIHFMGIWLIALGYMLISKKNRPILKTIGRKPKGNTWRKFLLGILAGVCLNGICILVAWIRKDVYLEYIAIHPFSLFVIFLCVLVQSSAEEFLCRGFLYQKGMKFFRIPVISILVNAALFSFLHLFNEGVTIISLINIFLFGLMFSLIVYYMDSIWCAFGVHAAWNFTQNIVFGLPNSGIVVPYSIFKLNASTARSSFAYNVNFGIEGTIVADIVLVLACIALFIWGRKYGKKPYDVFI